MCKHLFATILLLLSTAYYIESKVCVPINFDQIRGEVVQIKLFGTYVGCWHSAFTADSRIFKVPGPAEDTVRTALILKTKIYVQTKTEDLAGDFLINVDWNNFINKGNQTAKFLKNNSMIVLNSFIFLSCIESMWYYILTKKVTISNTLHHKLIISFPKLMLQHHSEKLNTCNWMKKI